MGVGGAEGSGIVVDIDVEGGLEANPCPPSVPASRPLDQFMDLAGIDAPSFRRLDPAKLTDEPTL